MGKRSVRVFLALVFALLLPGSPAWAGDGAPVSMEISTVYGDMGKFGSHIPLVITFYGQSETPFNGTVNVKTLESTPDNSDEVYQYSFPVSVKLAETEKKEIYIPLGQKSSGIHVALCDQGGREVDSCSLSFDVSRDMGRLLIGGLAGEEEELSYFDGVHLEYGMVDSRLILLDQKALPSDARGLELLDILLINGFSTESLTEDQRTAILQWVERGGTLLLGTGQEAEKVLGGFSEDLGGVRIRGYEKKKVGLGVEYAQDSPEDAQVELMCAELSVPGGRVVMEGDDIPLLTVIRRGKGKMGFFSYDLGEIRGFAEKTPGYVAEILTKTLGQEAVSQLYYYSSYGRNDDYWSAQSLVSTGSVDRLPRIPLYMAVTAVYILAAGPGLYLYLKKKDLSRYYGISVVIASAAASAVIYLLGTGTRFTSEFYTLATVLDTSGDTVEETTFLDVRTPDSRPFSLRVPVEYSITPLTRSSQYEEQPVQAFDGKQAADVRIAREEDAAVLSASRSRAFDPRYFKLESRGERTFPGRIEGDLRLFEGKLSGYIRNGYDFPLTDSAVFFYGQVCPLGDLEPGEVRELKEEPVLNWPVNMTYLAAQWLVERDSAGKELDDEELLRNTDRRSLYGWYLDQTYGGAYVSGARFSALGPEQGLWEWVSPDGQAADGQVLYTQELEMTTEKGGSVWRSGLYNPQQVVSGNMGYGSDGLSLYGTEPVTVEYFLGTDLDVEKVAFTFISPEFFSGEDFYYIRPFEGEACFYNNETKNYDPVDLSGGGFTESVLAPYLSAENSLVVKYTAEEGDTSGVTSMLPVPVVTGRKR